MYRDLRAVGNTLGRKGLALSIRQMLQAASLPYCLLKVKTMGQAQHVCEAVDFVFHHFNGLIQPEQVRSEIVALLQAIDERKPKCVLEIGTANGGTMFLFSRAASPDAHLVSVDLPRKDRFHAYRKWRRRLVESFALPNQQIDLVLGDSHERATLEAVKAQLGDRRVEFLFIDGDHSYEGAKRDFEMYSPLVERDGLIAFHDIATQRDDCGVPKLWNEIKTRYPCVEFVKDWNRGYGIGLVRNQPPSA